MKFLKFLPLTILLQAGPAFAEPPPEGSIEELARPVDPAAPPLQPGDLPRLEFRATSMLFFGTAFGVAGVEVGWVSPTGFTAEIQAFYLMALAGAGYQATARVGQRFYGPGTDLVRDENRFYTAFTPLAGVRYGVFPYMGTSDGYGYRSTDLGLQVGVAFDWGYGSLSGFASRIEGLVTYNVYSDPSHGGDWTYATDMNPTLTFDIGVLFGAYTSL